MRTFFSDPTGTKEELLAATYRALHQHGYTALSLQTIGEEFPKSTSLIYHHYDSKDALVVDCLDAMLDQLEANIPAEPSDPHESIAAFLTMIYADPDSEDYQFLRALTEIRGQAPHDDAFQAQFRRADRILQRRLETAIAAGVEREVFVVENAERTANQLYTLLTGAMVRRTSTGDSVCLNAFHAAVESLLGAEFIAPSLEES